MHKKLWLLLLLFISNSLYAQTVDCNYYLKLKIVDFDNGIVLPSAVVIFDDDNFSASSDENGYVILKVCKAKHQVEIKYISYVTEKLSVDLSKQTEYVVKLKSIARNLGNVNIISERTNIQTSMSKIELKGAELEKTRGLSLADALKEIPGVTTLNTGPTISKPIIQGMHSSRILIINNGIRQEGQQWGTEHAPEIDAFIANKLTVIKGAGSIKYGSDAIGGVILVEPKQLLDTAGITGEINVVGITNGQQAITSGILEGMLKKIPLQWRVQGTLKRSGDLKAPNYYLSNTGFYERNFSWALAYKHKRLNVELFYSQFNTDIGILRSAHIGNLTDLANAVTSSVPAYTSNFTYKINRPKQEVLHELFKVKSDYLINENSKLQLVLARQYNMRNEFDKDLPRNDSLAALNLPELHYEITTYTSDLSYQVQLNSKLSSSIGITSNNQRNTFEGRQFIPNFINDNYAIYTIHQYKLEKVMFDFGARYDYRKLDVFKAMPNGSVYKPERSFDNLTFNAGVDIEVNKYVDYHLNIGTAFRAPSINELHASGLHHGEGKYIISNENLRAEKAKAIITGIEINSFKKITAHIDAYYKVVQDFIYLNPAMNTILSIRGAFPSFEYKQTDAYFTGIDARVNYQINNNFRTLHKANFIRAFNMTDKEFLPFIPADRFENGLQYKFKNYKTFENAQVTFNVLNVLKQTRLQENSDYKDAPNAYMLVSIDASSTINIYKEHLEIGFTINNLLNTTYREYMNAFRYFSDEQGRSIVMRLKYHF
jgi:iron complex outermembrane receptor protein